MFKSSIQYPIQPIASSSWTAKFLSVIKSLWLVGAGTLTYSRVVVHVYLIKIVYVLENCLFTAEIHAQSDIYLL